MSINISNSLYSGEVLDNLLAKVALENELVRKGLIHIQQGVQYKFAIPRIKVGELLQKRNADPRKNNLAKGVINYDERVLEVHDFMAYTEFNPASFEHIWRPFQPQGNLDFQTLPANVQGDLLEAITDEIEEEMGDQYINGIYSATGLMNGIVARILSDSDSVNVASTATTMIEKLKDLWKAIPQTLKKNSALKIVCNVNDAMEYDFELKAQTSKAADWTQEQGLTFNGTPVVGLANWPEGLIVASILSQDVKSNWWAACNLQSDANVLQVDKTENASELYFVKLLMKADTQCAWSEYNVILDGREATSATVASNIVTPTAYVNALEYKTALSADATWTIATANMELGATLTIKNAQSGAYKIKIGDVEIAKGASRTFHFDGTAWV